MLASCALAGLSLDAQIGKKVFISVDMEGISGISGADQLSSAGAEYNRSRKLMADDTNAAIRGARAGGATEIVVNDSHGSMRNLRLEDLEGGVRLISHSFKPGCRDEHDVRVDAAAHRPTSATPVRDEWCDRRWGLILPRQSFNVLANSSSPPMLLNKP